MKVYSLKILSFKIHLLLYLCSALFSYAQEKQIKYNNQIWFQYYNQSKISERIFIIGDGGIRLNSKTGQKTSSLGRLGVQVKINNTINTSLAAAYFASYTNDEISREEWRCSQDLNSQFLNARFKWNHRLRIEERFFHTLNTGKSNFNVRYRYRIYMTYSLLGTEEKNALYINAGDEIFLNSGKEIVYNYFDQNRILIGVGYKPYKNLLINLTFVYQFVQKNLAYTFEESNIVWLGIYHTIDFTKKAN